MAVQAVEGGTKPSSLQDEVKAASCAYLGGF